MKTRKKCSLSGLITQLVNWLNPKYTVKALAFSERVKYYESKERIKQVAMLVQKMCQENMSVNIICCNDECPNLTNTEMPIRDYVLNGAGKCQKCSTELYISSTKSIPTNKRND